MEVYPGQYSPAVRIARRARKKAQVINSEHQIRTEADKLIRLAGVLGLEFGKLLLVFFEQVSQFPNDL
jgi:hypothetical protein